MQAMQSEARSFEAVLLRTWQEFWCPAAYPQTLLLFIRLSLELQYNVKKRTPIKYQVERVNDEGSNKSRWSENWYLFIYRPNQTVSNSKNPTNGESGLCWTWNKTKPENHSLMTVKEPPWFSLFLNCYQYSIMGPRPHSSVDQSP